MDNIVADVRSFKTPITKTWYKNGFEIIDDGEHNLVLITSDDRLKDLEKTVAETLKQENFDLVYIPISTGNRNYIDWVNDQTITRLAAVAK